MIHTNFEMVEKMKYWEQCIEEAFGDIGIIASPEQIKKVADWVEGAHENYGLATGYDLIPNPLRTENENLKKDLKKEQEKISCPACNGEGRIVDNFGPSGRTSTSSCQKCYGKGRVSP